MSTTYIIDGYNLLHRAYAARLESSTLQEARSFLEGKLRRFKDQRREDCEIFLVFDGAGRGGCARTSSGGIRVIYSEGSQSADDVILEMCRRLEGETDLCVVTSDFEDIAFRIRGLACRHRSSEDFAEQLEEVEAGARAADPSDRPDSVSPREVDGWLREFGMHPDEDEG